MTNPIANSNSAEQPTYLVAGHTTRDLMDSSSRIGGTVAYSSIAARRLGLNVRVVTAHGPDLDTGQAFDGAELIVLPSRKTTTFRNREDSGFRTQELLERGDNLTAGTLSDAWRSPDILHLAPVFREIDLAFISSFSPRICAATLQGWMRAADHLNQVFAEVTSDWNEVLETLDIAILSHADLNDNLIWRRDIRDSVPVSVETLGAMGCLVVEAGREYRVPADGINEIDTTGAGDIFAAGFLFEFLSSGDSVGAGRFANELTRQLLCDIDLRRPLTETR